MLSQVDKEVPDSDTKNDDEMTAEDGSHDSGVGTQLFGGKRQHTAHQLCQNDTEEQRHADHDGIAHDVLILAGEQEGVHQIDAQTVHDAQHCTHDGRDPQLLAQNLYKVLKGKR